MTTEYSLDWHGNEVTRSLESQLATRLDSATEYLRQRVTTNLGPPDHDPRRGSRPGEYPLSNEGQLKEHVLVGHPDPLTRRLYTDSDYGLWLEIGTRRMRPRPFLSRTLQEEQDRVAEILTRGIDLK
jgi:hypothetical protein